MRCVGWGLGWGLVGGLFIDRATLLLCEIPLCGVQKEKIPCAECGFRRQAFSWGLDWGLGWGLDWGLDWGLGWGLGWGLDWSRHSVGVSFGV